MAALDAHHMRPLLFFGYTNPLYENDHSVSTDEGRAAFVRWAAAAVRHFRGRGILWEMYNEPNNVVFWRPKVEHQQYIKLATAVGKALRESAPDETYIGPASCYIDFPFLESCFKAGLLEYWSAVTVHPYRPAVPETVAADYVKLRKMIDQYAPKGKQVPIYSAEWGYPSVWITGVMTDEAQGKVLPRELLTNLACGIPLSIWYVWRDNGVDPKDPQDHFGIVRHPYLPNKTPVYEPKPAYESAKTLLGTLKGYRFRNRLAVGGPEDYVLAFEKDQGKDDVRLVAWTIAKASRTVVIPTAAGRYAATDHVGKMLPTLTADANGLAVVLTDAPTYLVPEGSGGKTIGND